MPKKRKYDWPALFKAFEQSGATQTQFCVDHGINPKYFSQKLSQHRSQSSFSKVEVKNTPLNGLTLEVGQCKIVCPSNMPLESLVFLVRTLA